MISIQNFNKKFNDKIIYQNLNLEISPGECVALLGKSGIGKTVLMNSIRHGDNGIRCHSNKISFMQQKPIVFPWMTCIENIKLGNNSSSITEVDEIVQMLGLNEYVNKFPNQLSGGTIQRIAFARMLLQRADIILLDEPLSAVDEITALSILEQLAPLFKNKTLLLVTHDIMEAIRFTSRIICIGENGNIRLDAASQDVTYDLILNTLKIG